MTSRRSIAVLLCAATLSALAAPSRSARADGEADAKDLFTKGRELRSKGDCQGALPLFRKAAQLFPSGLGSLRNLAECEETLHLWASARRDWVDLKRALLTMHDAKYEGWDAEAEAAASRLAPKVAKLTITIVQKGGDDAAIDPAPFRLTINGEPLDKRLIGTELDRDPGTYAVHVEGGKEPAEESVALVEGESKRLAIAVVPPDSMLTKTDASGDVVTTTGGRDDHATMRTLGWSAVTVGGVGVAGAVVSLLVRQSALSQVKSKCPSYETSACTDQSVGSDASRGRTASILVDVFGAVAVVGLGVGLVLVVTHPKPADSGTTSPLPSAATTTLRVSPLATLGGGGAMLTGEF